MGGAGAGVGSRLSEGGKEVGKDVRGADRVSGVLDQRTMAVAV